MNDFWLRWNDWNASQKIIYHIKPAHKKKISKNGFDTLTHRGIYDNLSLLLFLLIPVQIDFWNWSRRDTHILDNHWTNRRNFGRKKLLMWGFGQKMEYTNSFGLLECWILIIIVSTLIQDESFLAQKIKGKNFSLYFDDSIYSIVVT